MAKEGVTKRGVPNARAPRMEADVSESACLPSLHQSPHCKLTLIISLVKPALVSIIIIMIIMRLAWSLQVIAARPYPRGFAYYRRSRSD